VLAMGSRFNLLLFSQMLRQPRSLVGAMTGEEETLARLAEQPDALLICTTALETGSGLSLVRRARAAAPERQILLIATGEPLPSVAELRQCEANAVVLEKDMGEGEFPLVQALLALARGRRYRSPSLQPRPSPPAAQESGSGDPTAAPTPAHEEGPRLSPREQEVLRLLAEGLSDRAIAEAMAISHHTARSYVKAVRRKLGVRNRLAAVVRSLRGQQPDSPLN